MSPTTQGRTNYLATWAVRSMFGGRVPGKSVHEYLAKMDQDRLLHYLDYDPRGVEATQGAREIYVIDEEDYLYRVSITGTEEVRVTPVLDTVEDVQECIRDLTSRISEEPEHSDHWRAEIEMLVASLTGTSVVRGGGLHTKTNDDSALLRPEVSRPGIRR